MANDEKLTLNKGNAVSISLKDNSPLGAKLQFRLSIENVVEVKPIAPDPTLRRSGSEKPLDFRIKALAKGKTTLTFFETDNQTPEAPEVVVKVLQVGVIDS